MIVSLIMEHLSSWWGRRGYDRIVNYGASLFLVGRRGYDCMMVRLTTTYLWNQCLPPLTLWVIIPLMARCIWYNIIWYKVCQWLAAGLWFSPGIPISSDRHDITKIMVKVTLNTRTLLFSNWPYHTIHDMAFQSFDFKAYLMKIILDTHCAH